MEVHCVNLDKLEFIQDEYLVRIKTSAGDCCDLADEKDNSYDIVFSNSVIEHVGDLQRQKLFAQNALRLGQKLWIQTPAKYFPIEPHWFALFIHWFPRKYQYSLFRLFALRQRFAGVKLSKKEIKAQVDDVRLMTKRELKEMFPGCRIITERFFLFPKSYIVVKAWRKLALKFLLLPKGFPFLNEFDSLSWSDAATLSWTSDCDAAIVRSTVGGIKSSIFEDGIQS